MGSFVRMLSIAPVHFKFLLNAGFWKSYLISFISVFSSVKWITHSVSLKELLGLNEMSHVKSL